MHYYQGEAPCVYRVHEKSILIGEELGGCWGLYSSCRPCRRHFLPRRFLLLVVSSSSSCRSPLPHDRYILPPPPSRHRRILLVVLLFPSSLSYPPAPCCHVILPSSSSSSLSSTHCHWPSSLALSMSCRPCSIRRHRVALVHYLGLASFDTSALGSLHLPVFRHVGVGILTPSCHSTHRCWVLILFVFLVESDTYRPTSLARGEGQLGLSSPVVVMGSHCCGRGVFQVMFLSSPLSLVIAVIMIVVVVAIVLVLVDAVAVVVFVLLVAAVGV